jgi:orotidine-5'-phosphate decarboxylase
VTVSFADRFAALRGGPGPLVFGLDPSGPLLEAWGLGDDPAGLDRFAGVVLEAAAGSVGIVKPQSAFYERHGWQGMRTLTRLVAEARSAGLLVVLDAKRGDVGSTNDAYAEVFLGEDAPLRCDAVTVHPYLGLGAMNAFVERAQRTGSCLLVVTRSSNADGRPVQTALASCGRSVEQLLLGEIARLNGALAPGGIGPVGAVVSPTHSGSEGELDLPAANAIFLAPGLGAQGATVADVAETFAACPDRVMPSASRSLLEHGPDVHRLREAIEELAAELRGALGSS